MFLSRNIDAKEPPGESNTLISIRRARACQGSMVIFIYRDKGLSQDELLAVVSILFRLLEYVGIHSLCSDASCYFFCAISSRRFHFKGTLRGYTRDWNGRRRCDGHGPTFGWASETTQLWPSVRSAWRL